VTFDDGYADNLHVALPILERHGVPATVFVATGYLDGGRMFNDTLTELVARARGPRLDLTGARLGRHDLDGAGARVAAVRSLLEQAKRLAPEERAARIAAAAAAVGAADLPDDLMLTSAQVRELADRGVEIGAHTATHAILTTLDPAGAEREITVSRRRLEEITGRAVRTFAYPNGIPGRDYAREHSELVRQLGFACAVTTARGVATAATDRFQLPRFQPWTGSPFKLAAHLMRNARAGGALAQA
jgi:peptidoglycan/xylan/chitin deacetylase (PgdA/CDA1 family)